MKQKIMSKTIQVEKDHIEFQRQMNEIELNEDVKFTQTHIFFANGRIMYTAVLWINTYIEESKKLNVGK
jgi:hypothetical protein